MAEKINLAYLVSHPIQYQAPLLREIAALPDVSLKVFFCSDFSVQQYVDDEFGHTVQWDTPLLEGYEYEFLPALGKRSQIGRFSPFVYGMTHRLKNLKRSQSQGNLDTHVALHPLIEFWVSSQVSLAD